MTPKKIKSARAKAGLTQRECAELLRVTINAWQKWEQGSRVMSMAYWELFQIKVKELE